METKGGDEMNFFCPFAKSTCREDCVFYTNAPIRSSESHCRLDEAAVNLDYIGGVIAEKVSREEDSSDNQQ